ncbi:uracil-DNA glycosylase [Gammaproteobacteria bacterium 45_16_T64]|nr:uracil-DNA glycosylase [Gammaproteobacteria bacterium 45_16_T64]
MSEVIDRVKLEASWKEQLASEFDTEYMQALRAFLLQQKQAGKVIYPPGDEYFNAFNYTPFDQVKVVILGQDPYHGPGQAHGLCFSVPEGVRPPPSLKNIFKEINRDLGLPVPSHGCLTSWANQGVLLLNSVLTVEQATAGAHQKKGWEKFTDSVIRCVNDHQEGVVFMLWGSYAHKKGQFIDDTKHKVLRSVHPSPLSAHRGFLGCGHFSEANEYLATLGKGPIDWSLPS